MEFIDMFERKAFHPLNHSINFPGVVIQMQFYINLEGKPNANIVYDLCLHVRNYYKCCREKIIYKTFIKSLSHFLHWIFTLFNFQNHSKCAKEVIIF